MGLVDDVQSNGQKINKKNRKQDRENDPDHARGFSIPKGALNAATWAYTIWLGKENTDKKLVENTLHIR